MTESSHYVHGSAREEQSRLELMNEILNERCVAELALRGGEQVLDVGAGLARFAREMARTGAARVVAVERDEQQLAAARERLRGDELASHVELRAGDAYELPLAESEWGSFDVAWSRFLLEHVPDPQRVVEAMVRALKPGGRIVLCDDDHELLRVDPDAPAFGRVWRAYERTYSSRGNDPAIGRRLPRLIHAAGATPTRNTWVFFGSCAGARDWQLVIDNCRGILTGAREQIEAHLARGEFDAGLAEYDAWAQRPDASYWLPLAWAEGRR
jgi:ubiquinone/menaquinone biosynthesis C-methylase UbiE